MHKKICLIPKKQIQFECFVEIIFDFNLFDYRFIIWKIKIKETFYVVCTEIIIILRARNI